MAALQPAIPLGATVPPLAADCFPPPLASTPSRKALPRPASAGPHPHRRVILLCVPRSWPPLLAVVTLTTLVTLVATLGLDSPGNTSMRPLFDHLGHNLVDTVLRPSRQVSAVVQSSMPATLGSLCNVSHAQMAPIVSLGRLVTTGVGALPLNATHVAAATDWLAHGVSWKRGLHTDSVRRTIS